MAAAMVRMKMKLFFKGILWYTMNNMRKKEGKTC